MAFWFNPLYANLNIYRLFEYFHWLIQVNETKFKNKSDGNYKFYLWLSILKLWNPKFFAIL